MGARAARGRRRRGLSREEERDPAFPAKRRSRMNPEIARMRAARPEHDVHVVVAHSVIANATRPLEIVLTTPLQRLEVHRQARVRPYRGGYRR